MKNIVKNTGKIILQFISGIMGGALAFTATSYAISAIILMIAFSFQTPTNNILTIIVSGIIILIILLMQTLGTLLPIIFINGKTKKIPISFEKKLIFSSILISGVFLWFSGKAMLIAMPMFAPDKGEILPYLIGLLIIPSIIITAGVKMKDF